MDAGSMWHQLWGVGVLAIAGGVLVAVFLLLYYWIRGWNPVFRSPCPWCSEELSEDIVGESGERRQECSNPKCQLKAITLKKR
ncbi:MAG: hypothetical protein HYW90_02080 [Candidatus Sungbacteria bacterium]|nr:hypothetical protein [Candidatus Sungbacteria bacterium]